MGSKWVGEHAGCTPSPFPFLMGRVIAKSSVMALPGDPCCVTLSAKNEKYFYFSWGFYSVDTQSLLIVCGNGGFFPQFVDVDGLRVETEGIVSLLCPLPWIKEDQGLKHMSYCNVPEGKEVFLLVWRVQSCNDSAHILGNACPLVSLSCQQRRIATSDRVEQRARVSIRGIPDQAVQ
jgi:hypothetical protein